MEEEREARRFAVIRSDHDLCHLALTKKGLAELILIGHHILRHLFVVGELTDEVEDQTDVINGGEAEGDAGVAGGDGVFHGVILAQCSSSNAGMCSRDGRTTSFMNRRCVQPRRPHHKLHEPLVRAAETAAPQAPIDQYWG